MRRVLWSLLLSTIISTWIICIKFVEPLYLYDSIIIEVDYVNNCYPYDTSLKWFKNKVDEIGICKKESIFIEKNDNLGPQIYVPRITVDQLAYLEMAKRTYSPATNSNTLIIYLECLCGDCAYGDEPDDNSMVIGLTYDYSSIALFYPSVRYGEQIVLVHELIHVILEDAPDQHCKNRNCIMAPITLPDNVTLDTPCQQKINRLIKQKT